MQVVVRKYKENDIPEMIEIWNEIVEKGIAFPQEEYLTCESGNKFFAEQSYTGVAVDSDSGKIHGLYILHPNNIGRCGHICNASYAVSVKSREYISVKNWAIVFVTLYIRNKFLIAIEFQCFIW